MPSLDQDAAQPLESLAEFTGNLTYGSATLPAAFAPLVVLAGPPAAGKGTQSAKIQERYGMVHVSTGDMLRWHVSERTALGLRARQYMDAGSLVPSDLIIEIVLARLAQPDVKERGALLDGFPRTAEQARALVEVGLFVARFLHIKVPDDALVERACGRRLDPETGKIYHLHFNAPPPHVVSQLVWRSDDHEDKIRARLQAYHSQIESVLPFFQRVLGEVDGSGSPDEVFRQVAASLDQVVM